MKKKKYHPYIPELVNLLENGKVTRREFIRNAALLGVSVGVASQIAGMPFAKRAFASSIQRGGEIKIASGIQKITHPAQISWAITANQMRNITEYLTYTDPENITHPYLLKNWEASEDLKTWTLYVREGIKFNNGDEFTADDVIFTFKEWLNKDVASSIYGVIGNYLDPAGIEKVNNFQIKLHLNRPEIALPEHLFMYNALVVNHRTFEGDFIKTPHGTGPYTLDTYRPGEIIILKRRNDYWKKGDDGKPLPYMDVVKFIDMGEEMSPRIAALKAGEIDSIDLAGGGAISAYLALKDNPGDINIQSVTTATTRVMGMRADVKPWTDNRVRMALKLCQNREKILQLAFFGQGLQGQDCHVAPVHPEYCPKPIPAYNPEKAKELLKQAGYPNGVDVTIHIGSGWSDIVRYAEVLKQDSAPAGFRITIDAMPNKAYWDKWTEFPFKVTNWKHRPLGTMVPPLAYTADKDGKPVKWNETRWVDEEFSKLLIQASGTLDLEERRKIFCKLEDIQMSRGSVAIAYWMNLWLMTRKRVKNAKAHPGVANFLGDVWLDQTT
jgi:peptide/nickel transport system substrate-binding protein